MSLDDPFAEHALAIGFLCKEWAFLEFMIDQLIASILAMPFDDTSQALTANISFRNKIQVLLAVGLVKKPDDEWYENLRTLLNQTDNNLRVRRNRCVHDLWNYEGGGFTKYEIRPTIKRPQARKQLELRSFHASELRPEEIWALGREVSDVWAAVHLATRAYRGLLPKKPHGK
jgi:hypothetical protein